MRRIYDLSLTIQPQLPVWPGDEPVTVVQTSFTEQGDPCNLSHFKMSMHAGTHVDLPLHFLGGGVDAAAADLGKFTGRAVVVAIDGPAAAVGPEHLCHTALAADDIVLLNIAANNALLTREEFCRDFVYLSPAGAEYLIAQGIKGVGINYFSVDRYGAPGSPVHHLLLGREIMILEGLNLQNIQSGVYQIYFFPLKFANGNGSPVRAVLMDWE